MEHMIVDRRSALTMAAVLGFSGATLYALPARAGTNETQDQSYYAGLSCNQLWYERNKIFAAAGFCFMSDRAISVFGTRCFPPYGELPDYRRNLVHEILGYEQAKGCR
jgi:hypothetical protein